MRDELTLSADAKEDKPSSPISLFTKLNETRKTVDNLKKFSIRFNEVRDE